jgi:hypothetical protein
MKETLGARSHTRDLPGKRDGKHYTRLDQFRLVRRVAFGSAFVLLPSCSDPGDEQSESYRESDEALEVQGMDSVKPNADSLELPPEELKKRRAQIREYFAERVRRLPIEATSVMPSGQTIDWIPVESQVPGGSLPRPPMFEPAPKADADARQRSLKGSMPPPETDSDALTELQRYPDLKGPAGTVPVVRFDVEGYLKSTKNLPANPADVLYKVPPPSPESNDRYYGVWQRFGTVYGSAGRINIWNVTGPVTGETSIAQVAVIRGTPMQAIEAGKIEFPGINSSRPYFFVYYRTNDGATGDWVGGYDTTVDGWIQYGSSVAPQMSLVPWESSSGSSQYSLDVEVRLWEGNWWVWAAGEWAGYYPYCIGGQWYGPCPSGTLFSSSGIRDEADRLDWYGEVFDSSAPAATSTDMGSGEYASAGWSRAAYFRNLTYYWQPNTYWWWNSGSPSATDSNCYSVSGPFYSNDAAWHNWYYFGGPGTEGNGCN